MNDFPLRRTNTRYPTPVRVEIVFFLFRSRVIHCHVRECDGEHGPEHGLVFEHGAEVTR